MTDQEMAAVQEIVKKDLERKQAEAEPVEAINAFRTKKGHYLASVSKEWLDQAISYSAANDLAALQQLIDSKKVFPLKAGILVYVEDSSLWGGWVKIRPKGSTIAVYTVREAITK